MDNVPVDGGSGDGLAWRGASELMDVGSPRLRLRAQSITHLSPGDGAKAIAIYTFVKRLPFRIRPRLRPRTADEVLQAGCGDAAEKATLMVALLRAIGVPARLRMIAYRGELLRGLTEGLERITRPIVEVHLRGGWQGTDTFVFPASYQVAARGLLRTAGWECGYGLHLRGSMSWWAVESAFLTGRLPHEDPLVLEDLGIYHDMAQYEQSPGFAAQHARLPRWVRLQVLAPFVQRRVQEVLDLGGHHALSEA